MKLAVTIVLCAWLIAPARVRGNMFYCSTSGSGSNPGTIGSPWDLNTGLSALTNNNVIVLIAGNFWSGTHYTINAVGPATLLSQPKWSSGIVSGDRWNLAFAQNHSISNITIDGLVLTNASASTGLSDGDGVALNYASYCTIQNCWIGWNTNHGINSGSVGTFGGNIFRYNLIEYNGKDTISFPGHYHNCYISGPNNQFYGNVDRNCYDGEGIQFYTEDATQTETNNFIYNNLIYGSTNQAAAGQGYTMDLYSATRQSSGPINPGTNYFFGNTLWGSLFYAYGDLDLTNNVIYAAPGKTNLVAGSIPSNLHGDYNASASALLGSAHEVIVSFSGAGFDNTGKGLYWLTSGSPLRNAALANIHGPSDFFGNTLSTAPDIGFNQYSSTYAADARTLDPSPAGGADYWLVLTVLPYTWTGGAGTSGSVTR